MAQSTTYYATIFLQDSDDKIHEIDSRPSDAIAVALRMSTPVYVSEEVFANSFGEQETYHDEKRSILTKTDHPIDVRVAP
jgi:hypothetical protein